MYSLWWKNGPGLTRWSLTLWKCSLLSQHFICWNKTKWHPHNTIPFKYQLHPYPKTSVGPRSFCVPGQGVPSQPGFLTGRGLSPWPQAALTMTLDAQRALCHAACEKVLQRHMREVLQGSLTAGEGLARSDQAHPPAWGTLSSSATLNKSGTSLISLIIPGRDNSTYLLQPLCELNKTH